MKWSDDEKVYDIACKNHTVEGRHMVADGWDWLIGSIFERWANRIEKMK